MTSDYNTGSDLFPREGAGRLRPDQRPHRHPRAASRSWALEVWAQNLFNKNYQQVAFNSPFQGGGQPGADSRRSASAANQIFSSFLAEPRTYGVTLRTRF